MCQNKHRNLNRRLEHFRKCCSQSSQARYNRLLGSGDKYYTAAAPWRWCQVAATSGRASKSPIPVEHLKKPANLQVPKLAISGTFKLTSLAAFRSAGVNGKVTRIFG